jgi:phosphoribosylformylglycinamidine cyclo-ligase
MRVRVLLGAPFFVERLSMSLRNALSALKEQHTAIGSFGGTFHLPLVSTVDGVGTKTRLATMLGGNAHKMIGRDVVVHCINDLLAVGAEPLFFLDYVGMHEFNESVFNAVLEGISDVCQEHNIALVGGETAIMPSIYQEGQYDVVGTLVGQQRHTFDNIQIGDLIIGLPSVGLHTNGYTEAFKALKLTGTYAKDEPTLNTFYDDFTTYADLLLAEHRCYTHYFNAARIHGAAHITGGGLKENIQRILPEGVSATLDKPSWPQLGYWSQLSEDVDDPYSVYNMGIGFVVIVPRRFPPLNDIFYHDEYYIIGEITAEVK